MTSNTTTVHQLVQTTRIEVISELCTLSFTAISNPSSCAPTPPQDEWHPRAKPRNYARCFSRDTNQPDPPGQVRAVTTQLRKMEPHDYHTCSPQESREPRTPLNKVLFQPHLIHLRPHLKDVLGAQPARDQA